MAGAFIESKGIQEEKHTRGVGITMIKALALFISLLLLKSCKCVEPAHNRSS
jgi:hypothetical protein